MDVHVSDIARLDRRAVYDTTELIPRSGIVPIVPVPCGQLEILFFPRVVRSP
jgi:hypothetical protein